ncbi:MAG: hypothetical protein KDH96_04465 [Candidatus Riesia sp.]|nr:hypothetical protein [Candidatus Riesia sp.]
MDKITVGSVLDIQLSSCTKKETVRITEIYIDTYIYGVYVKYLYLHDNSRDRYGILSYETFIESIV